MSERKVYRFGEQEWHIPMADGNSEQESLEAGRLGAKRRFLAQGDSGFFVQVVEIPPNFDAPGPQPRSRRGLHGPRGIGDRRR